MLRLAILCLLLAGCGNNSGSGPIVRDHGWEDGLYRVEIQGKPLYIAVAGDDVAFNGTDIHAKWVRFPSGRGVTGSGYWYMGSVSGYNVGIRRGYQVRLLWIILKAERVKGNG